MATYKIKLVKSLNGRLKIGQVTVQPDNDMTAGKIRQIGYLLEVTKED